MNRKKEERKRITYYTFAILIECLSRTYEWHARASFERLIISSVDRELDSVIVTLSLSIVRRSNLARIRFSYDPRLYLEVYRRLGVSQISVNVRLAQQRRTLSPKTWTIVHETGVKRWKFKNFFVSIERPPARVQFIRRFVFLFRRARVRVSLTLVEHLVASNLYPTDGCINVVDTNLRAFKKKKEKEKQRIFNCCKTYLLERSSYDRDGSPWTPTRHE